MHTEAFQINNNMEITYILESNLLKLQLGRAYLGINIGLDKSTAESEWMKRRLSRLLALPEVSLVARSNQLTLGSDGIVF